jgi:hypothetical protein
MPPKKTKPFPELEPHLMVLLSNNAKNDRTGSLNFYITVLPEAIRLLTPVKIVVTFIRNLGASEKLGSKRFADFAGFAG